VLLLVVESLVKRIKRVRITRQVGGGLRHCLGAGAHDIARTGYLTFWRALAILDKLRETILPLFGKIPDRRFERRPAFFLIGL
jgi:hypothetical protein